MTEAAPSLSADLARVIIEPARLAERVAELGDQIGRDYAGRQPVLVCTLKGSLLFTADLMRKIDLPLQLEVVGAAAYRGQTVASGRLRITKDVDSDLAGRDLILIEDVYDSGMTLHTVHDLLALHQPASLAICALLRKRKPRERELELRYVGFDIDDVFVVGYGLDYRERYRNLPCIGELRREIYQE